MKDRTTAVAGLAAGYLLGRTGKTRLTITLAAAAVIAKLGLRPSERLERRLEDLASSEVGKIAETARGELYDAVKQAASAAATSRIDALTDRVTSALPGTRASGDEDSEEEDEDTEEETNEEEENEEENGEDDEGPDDEVKKRRPVRRATPRSRSGSSSSPSKSRRRAETKDEKAPTTRRRTSRATSRSTR